MAKEGNKKKERIEELKEECNSLRASVTNMEERMQKRQQEIKDLYEKFDLQNSRIDKVAKMAGFCIFIAVVSIVLSIVLFFILNEATKRIYDLQEEVTTLQEDDTTLQKEVATLKTTTIATTQPNTVEEFINAVLPMGKEEYYDKNGNTFYSDPDCKYAIIDPVFCSLHYVCGNDSYENIIRIYRLANGGFAYIPVNFYVYLDKK